MNPTTSTASHLTIVCSKIADIVVLGLLVIFFVGFLAFDYELLGFHDSFLKIPHDGKQYFEAIPWIIFGVLVFDLYLKYIIIGRNLKLFFKHHWLDVSMAALIPILLPLKFVKVTLKMFKAAKATKFGYKLGHKVNKFLTAIKEKRIK
ncbi:MAG TPA: hypothetical protein VKA95_15505 [Nitrososphaeraceae archaeon]|nr:hypothetical protein [Nitrososphaeraceae archaeon]